MKYRNFTILCTHIFVCVQVCVPVICCVLQTLALSKCLSSRSYFALPPWVNVSASQGCPLPVFYFLVLIQTPERRKHCEQSKVSSLRTQHNDPSRGTNPDCLIRSRTCFQILSLFLSFLHVEGYSQAAKKGVSVWFTLQTWEAQWPNG